MHRTFIHHASAKGGYTLLMAVLTASILLSFALGIYAVALRDMLLATFFRHSQIAFAAADRGVECALFWDAGFPQNGWTYTAFATSTNYHLPAFPPERRCHVGNADVDIATSEWNETRTLISGTTLFTLYFSNGSCAMVRVEKTPTDPLVKTRISADGYNISTPGNCGASATRRTQRTLEVYLGN